jgi:TonB-linked SusC/RagA family outer membrane protein
VVQPNYFFLNNYYLLKLLTMKRVLLTFMMSVLVCVVIQAQDRTVTGKVTDETGQGLPTVTVQIKGTTTGQPTDADGNYRIAVPDNATLVFRFLGYTEVEEVVGNRSSINVQMNPEVSELDEVVVTALGITRDKASLGYAVTSIGSDDIQSKPESDVARILRGKVPGVDITQTSGMAGTGTNIIIRGYSSISGTNQPLFVIDGVPFNSDTNSDRGYATGGATASSRFLDLDPNNVADVSVLKGLSATVLYGEAGRNGVVLVTTKTGSSGSSKNKMDISFTQSYFVNEAASIPDDQDLYGNGFYNLASAAFSNWGAPFDQPGKNGTQVYAGDPTLAAQNHPYDRAAWNDALPEFIGAQHVYKAYDNLQNFFEKGSQVNTSLNISSRLSDVSSMSVAYGFIRDEGYVASNDYEKHNLSLGGRTKLNNGLTINSSFNFVTSKSNKPPAGISTSSNPAGTSLFSNVLYTPRSNDLTGWPFELPTTKESIYYRGNNGIQNPYWTLKNIVDEEKLNRFFGNVALSYDINDWLTANYRIGVDTYSQVTDYKINSRGINIPLGRYQTNNRLNTITNSDFTLSANRNINSDLNLDIMIGFNAKRETYQQTFVSSNTQFIFDLFTHQNFLTTTASTYRQEENTLGVYGTASLGYKDFLYLNVQARNDWTSTLEDANNSVFYPSVSASFLPLDAFGVSSSTFNYLKVRVGYGTSAGYPNPYRTRSTLSTNVNAFVSQNNGTIQTNSISTTFGNIDLAAEIHKELEVGIEGRFFKNKVTLDLSMYDKTSSDLIINLTLDPSTGFNNSTINAAEINNKGIEARITGTIIQNNDWNVSLTGNFTKNVSVVNKIAPGIDQVSFGGRGNYAIPGEPYGVIQSNPTLRDDNGNIIVTGSGLTQRDPNLGIIANPAPNFNAAIIGEVSYKFLSLRVQFDYQDGGDLVSATSYTLLGRGIAEATGFDRFVPVIQKGVKSDGTPNDIQITSTDQYWRNGGVFNGEFQVFDATHARLREISLSMVFPANWLAKTPFGSASLTLSGQNLWFFAQNFPDGMNFDPEVSSTGVGNGRGYELMSGPSSRKYGATLNFTF